MPIAYADLRRVAAGYMRREVRGHALQPTAPIHETYVRLVDQKQARGWERVTLAGVTASNLSTIGSYRVTLGCSTEVD
jgi:RNA polymerase sigma-70 factor (ECF subfamily)